MTDPLTAAEVDVLWVKGSGGDLGSMKLDGFATLYLDKLNDLKARFRGLAHEDEMVDLFSHCTFNLNPRATSIDTPLHCYIPHRHVDHMHADALIAIAAARNGERLTREIFGGEIGWIPWQRPGFDLGLKVEALVTSNPKMNGLVLGSHGLITWAATGKACYETTLRIIQQAADWLDAHGKPEPFGPTVTPALDKSRARNAARADRAGAARHAQRADQQGAALPRHAGRARIRRLRARRRNWPRRGRPVPIISCARRSRRSTCHSIRRARPRTICWRSCRR